MNKLYSKFLILTLTILCFGIVKSQTPISICPQVTTYSSMVRGYHFTAPCNFTICGLYVPPDASSGLQSVAVVRFNAGPPPAYSSTTNNFVQLFYQPNWPTNTMIPCNINVSAGQIIGVYGARGGSSMINSYGQAKCMTNILGYSVMLERSGMQYDLSTQPMHDIWSEVDYYIGRIIMYINCCPTASFTATNSVCLGAPVTVTYTGSGTAGVANFNWTFNNGSPATANTIGPHSVTWSTPGTYNIDLSVSQSGCTTVTSSQQIVVNPLPNANAGPDVSICQGQSTTLNGTGGNSFNWSNGATTPNITVAPTTTTTYTLTVTGIGGCTATDNVVVTVNNLPTANAGPDVTICQGETTTLNASGGGTYLWSNQATTSSITVSPSTTTTYTVTVTSAVGCSASDAVVVTVNPLPTANAGPDISICAGTSTVLNASGGSSYQWNTGSTNSSLTIAPLSTTTYIVTVYNSLGCSASDDIIVTVLPIPNANAGPDQSICLGSATTLTASGGIAYLWSTNQTTSQISVTPNQTTTYTVTVIDINTCTATDNVIVNVYTSPPVSASNDTSTCQGNPVILTAAGGNTYLWSTSETTASISVLPSTTTTYTVTVTDINGCSGTDNVVVTVNPIPLITASPSVANICIGDSITLNATGGISYTWAPSVGLSNNSIPNPVTSPSANITYTVTGYNQYGCTNSANVNITVEAFPLLAITPSNATICSGQSINLTASGASTYNWSPSTGLSSSTGANVTASPTITTTYTLTGFSAGGCSIDTTYVINVMPSPQINIISDTAAGCSPLTVHFSDLSSGNIISWLWNFDDPNSGPSNTSTLNNPTHTFNSPGTYDISLNIVDINGCSSILIVPDMINVYNNPTASFIASPSIGSIDEPSISFIDQSINAISWAWNFGEPASGTANFATSQTTSHSYLSPGNYLVTLTVTSINGCIDSTNKEITIQDSHTFWVPNAFTPNGDGINEFFIPKGTGINPDKFKMYIFDRWGNEIFYTNSYNNPWDGTIKNTKMIAPQGVYIWVIYTAERTGMEHKYIGRVTLLP